MEGKIRVKDLLFTKEQIEKSIESMDRLVTAMFQKESEFKKILEELGLEKVSSFDINGAKNYLRDYLKIVDHAINTAEADWPLK